MDAIGIFDGIVIIGLCATIALGVLIEIKRILDNDKT